MRNSRFFIIQNNFFLHARRLCIFSVENGILWMWNGSEEFLAMIFSNMQQSYYEFKKEIIKSWKMRFRGIFELEWISHVIFSRVHLSLHNWKVLDVKNGSWSSTKNSLKLKDSAAFSRWILKIQFSFHAGIDQKIIRKASITTKNPSKFQKLYQEFTKSEDKMRNKIHENRKLNWTKNDVQRLRSFGLKFIIASTQ